MSTDPVCRRCGSLVDPALIGEGEPCSACIVEEELWRLRQERDTARARAREFYRLADHLLLMHRRENRVMEGGEARIKEIQALCKEWLFEADGRVEDADGTHE